jgi:raffinose/stachyose/melibiose transport system permease protein
MAFLAPALLLYGVFTIGPLLLVGSYSLSSWQGASRGAFAGLDNFRLLFDIPPVRREIVGAFRNNVYFFVGTMLIQNSLGLALAVVLHEFGPGKRFFQTVIAIPFLVNPLVIGFVWTLLLNPAWGPVADLLRLIGMGESVRPWLGDPTTVRPIVVIINAWQWVGFPMLVFGAALASISRELLDAASVDGASRWATFRYVTMPQLVPAFGTVTLLTFIGTFNAFNLQFAIGGVNGSPGGRSDVLGLVFYRLAFGSGLNAIGLSSALAVLVFIFVFGCAVLLRKLLLRAEAGLS